MAEYPMPYSHIVLSQDREPLVVALDGSRIPLDEWKATRVQREEFNRLMCARRALAPEPDYEEHP